MEKLVEFRQLTEDIFSNVDYSTDDVTIGEYVGQLKAAYDELEKLAEQGLLTKESLDELNASYSSAKFHLDNNVKNYTDYYSGGSYNYSYEDEYIEARGRVEALESENEALKKEREYDNDKAISDFNGVVTEIKDLGVRGLNPDELTRYVDQLQALYNQMKVIHGEFGMSDELMFEKDTAFNEATAILAEARRKEETYQELIRLNERATLAKEEADLGDIVQQRRELITLSEACGWFDEETLNTQKAITDEIEKRIGLQNGIAGQAAADISADILDKAPIGEGNVSEEIQQLERLKSTLTEVKLAVDSKTKAFIDEGKFVGQSVGKEISALTHLHGILEDILAIVAQIDLAKALSTEGVATPSVSDSNALTNPVSNEDIDNNHDVSNPNQSGYALEDTLQTTNGLLKSILDSISNGDSFSVLVAPLKAAVDTLKDVSNGIIEEHKRKSVDTRDADTRIADSKSRADIEKAAKDAVFGRVMSGSTIDITGMSAMADGAVKVTGIIQTATDKWEEFTLQVDKANQVSKTAYNVNGKAAKEAEKAAEAAKKAVEETESVTDKINKELAKRAREKELLKITGQTNYEKNSLGFDFNARNLSPEQTEIVNLYDNLIREIDKYEVAIKHGQEVELTSIEQTKKALFDKIDAYKQANNIVNAGKTGNKKAFGASVVKNATTKYSGLSNRISSNSELAGSDVVQAQLAQYTAAYEHLINLQKQYKVGQVIDPKDEQEFNNARVACNDYAQALKKMLDLHAKTNTDQSEHWDLQGDFDVDSYSGRENAFRTFLSETYGAEATFEKFTDDYNKMIYTVKNGDGTFTRMTAVINNTKTAIDTMAGEAKETTNILAAFWSELKGKFKSIGAYVIASFSIHDIIRYVRTGVQYVREIDAALTELKKVTNETDAAYNNFLQDMSKTASVVGSTVSELTTMAAEWSRLGYDMADAAKLAESTAILLNVSEFKDATTASEALISTMQAFQYTADQSQHVVDILNEVGKLLPVDNYIG
jgi:hypothetical protein